MKITMTVITDKDGKFLGAVRNSYTQAGKDTLRAFPSPLRDHTQYNVEVDEEVIGKPFEEARSVLLSLISSKAV